MGHRAVGGAAEGGVRAGTADATQGHDMLSSFARESHGPVLNDRTPHLR